MKKTVLYTTIISLFAFSCVEDNDNVSPEPQLNEYELEVVDYFKEVALGFEFGNASEVTRRWNIDMKIFIGGNPTNELLSELDIILDDINSLCSSGFSVEIVDDSLRSNYYIFFGSGSSYAEVFPALSNLVHSNWGLFTVFWNGSNELYTGYMYVDILRANLIEQKHLLREELTQSLGLAKDSNLYTESIFQQAFSTKVTTFAEIDEDLIHLLYHPDMRTGLNESQVDGVLRSVLLEKNKVPNQGI